MVHNRGLAHPTISLLAAWTDSEHGVLTVGLLGLVSI